MRSIRKGDKVCVIRDIERLCERKDLSEPLEYKIYIKSGSVGIVQETFKQGMTGVWHAKVLCEGKIYTLRLTSLQREDSEN